MTLARSGPVQIALADGGCTDAFRRCYNNSPRAVGVCVRARTAAASATTRPASDQNGRYYIAVEPWRAAMGARHDEAEARTRYSAQHAVYMGGGRGWASAWALAAGNICAQTALRMTARHIDWRSAREQDHDAPCGSAQLASLCSLSRPLVPSIPRLVACTPRLAPLARPARNMFQDCFSPPPAPVAASRLVSSSQTQPALAPLAAAQHITSSSPPPPDRPRARSGTTCTRLTLVLSHCTPHRNNLCHPLIPDPPPATAGPRYPLLLSRTPPYLTRSLPPHHSFHFPAACFIFPFLCPCVRPGCRTRCNNTPSLFIKRDCLRRVLCSGFTFPPPPRHSPPLPGPRLALRV